MGTDSESKRKSELQIKLEQGNKTLEIYKENLNDASEAYDKAGSIVEKYVGG